MSGYMFRHMALIQCCSNEAFCLAVGLWPVRLDSLVLYPNFTTGITKLPRPVARSGIRQNSFYLVPCEVCRAMANLGHMHGRLMCAVCSRLRRSRQLVRPWPHAKGRAQRALPGHSERMYISFIFSSICPVASKGKRTDMVLRPYHAKTIF